MAATHPTNLRDMEKNPSAPQTSSPNSSSGSSSTSFSAVAASKNGNNGVAGAGAGGRSLAPAPAPTTPRSMEVSTYHTTFVQADPSSFKQVVQMLTGSPVTAAKHVSAAAPPSWPAAAKPPGGSKHQTFKLYERRSSMKNLKMIPLPPPAASLFRHPFSPAGGAAGASPIGGAAAFSPSTLDLPSLTLSPVTPLIPDPFNRRQMAAAPAAGSPEAMAAEERAIAEKGFYLHPSPRSTTTTPMGSSEPPRLLPLFPLASP